MPSAAASTGVPKGAARSMPVWKWAYWPSLGSSSTSVGPNPCVMCAPTIGHCSGHVGGLTLELAFRRLDLRDQVIQLCAEVVLADHQVVEGVHVGDKLVTQAGLAIEVGQASVAIGLQLEQVRFELGLQRVRAITGDNEIHGRHQCFTQAAGARDDLEQGLRLSVRGTGDGRDLGSLDVDAVLCLLDLSIELRDLVLEVGDGGLLLSDLVGKDLLADRRLVQSDAQPLLRGKCSRQVAAEACTEQVVDRWLRIGSRRARRRALCGARRG